MQGGQGRQINKDKEERSKVKGKRLRRIEVGG